MNQPFKLQLNSEALAALFPEGSQARVELQQAVVAEFIRKHFKEHALGVDVFNTIDRARTDAIQSVERARKDVMTNVLADTGLKTEWRRMVLQGEAKTKVEDAAKLIVERTAREAATKAAEEAVAKIATDINAAVQQRINTITDASIRAAVGMHINTVMASLAKATP